MARRLLAGLNTRVEAQGAHLVADESAIDVLVAHGYSESYGARRMRHVIDTRVREPLAKALLSQEIEAGAALVLSGVDGEIKVDVRKGAEAASRSPGRQRGGGSRAAGRPGLRDEPRTAGAC